MRFSAIFLVLCLSGAVATPISARDRVATALREEIAVLASDAFEGRAPGTPGETKTTDYIVKLWSGTGLKPAGRDGKWLSPVPLIQRSPVSSKFSFATKEKTLRFVADEIVMIGRDGVYQKKSLSVVFAGYGIDGDGKALSGVAGKVVLMLFDEPANAPQAMKSPRARREALVAAGAEAVLMVADNGQGNWTAIRRQLLSKPIALPSQEKRASLEGAVSSEFAVAMVTAAGRDWDTLRLHAREKTFNTENLGIVANFDVTTDIHIFDSNNVIAKIPGKKKGSGSVLFMAHWDHLGICEPESNNDKICNGAIDNASGVAVLTETARALAKGRYDRDIYFVATTAEESGLLGAQSFTENPPIPLDQIVAAFNIDTIAVAPAGAKVAIVGRGTTTLDKTIDDIALKLGRSVEPSTDANSFIPRQDGWVLQQKGVPAVMVGGAFSDLGRLQNFLTTAYHKPDDELTDATDLSGAAQDVTLHIELGRYFASARSYKGK